MAQNPAQTTVSTQAGSARDRQDGDPTAISLLQYRGLHAAADTQAGAGSALFSVRTDGSAESFRAERVEPLASTAAAKHLLLLSGSNEIAIEGLIYHVAEYAAAHAGRQAGRAQPIPIGGLADPHGYAGDLFSLIATIATPTVIVVEQASRRLTGWDLPKLAEAAAQHKHILLLAADGPLSNWRLSPEEQAYWQSCGDPDIYEPSYLLALMLSALEAFRPLGAPEVSIYIQQHLIEISRRLWYPFRIRAFGRALQSRVPSEAAQVDALVQEISSLDLRTMIGRWFHHELDRRGQLMALGLSLLEGVGEETALYHLGRMLHEVWDQPSGTIDRVDLLPLEPCFQIVERRRAHPALFARFAVQRRTIIQIALPGLRRSLSHSLFYLAEQVRRSLGSPDESADVALRSDRVELRAAASQAFAEIGAIAPELVDGPLLLLVADGRAPARDRVAAALAAWYAGASAERVQFFEFIRRWTDEAHSRAMVSGIRTRINADAPGDPADWIAAALLAAFCESARSDRANQISTDLMELLPLIAARPGPAAQQAISERILAQLLPQHLAQLDPWLQVWAAAAPLRAAIVGRLSDLARSSDELDVQVALLINRWKEAAVQAAPHQEQAAPAAVDHALITASEIYTNLHRYGNNQRGSTLGTIRLLREFHALPRHPQTQRAVEWALLQLGTRDPALWNMLLSDLDSAAIDRYAELLRDLHLEEYAAMSGGNLELEVNSRRYRVSSEHELPQTTSCQFIDYVLATEGQAAAYVLAFRAGMAMTRDFDLPVMKKISEIRNPLVAAAPAAPAKAAKAAPAKQADVAPAEPIQRGPGFYRDVFLPIMVTRNRPELRTRIATLLPYAEQVNLADQAILGHMLEQRWGQLDRGDTREVAKRLAEALDLARQGPRSADVLFDIDTLPSLIQALKEEGMLPLAFAALVLFVVLLAVLSLLISQFVG